jgi:hypothetical protein
MNELNYTTLEVSQRLYEKGIVLETEKVWALNEWPVTIDSHVIYKEEWRLIDRPMIGYKKQIPAPSMAEVWRELPDHLDSPLSDLVITKDSMGITTCFYKVGHECESTNPTDALIDLLIWVVEQRKEENHG